MDGRPQNQPTRGDKPNILGRVIGGALTLARMTGLAPDHEIPKSRGTRKPTREDKLSVQGIVIAGALTLTNMTGLTPNREIRPKNLPHDQPPTVTRPAPAERAGSDLNTSVVYAGPPRRTQLRAELHTILDSVLITKAIPPGVPFEDRVGEVNDERIRKLMKEIDKNLGGRIEWPNVYVAEGLMEKTGALGHYYQGTHQKDGRTAAAEDNHGKNEHALYGITLDKKLVDDEFATGRAISRSIRSVLVHELQHATSADNATELTARAKATDWEYKPANQPYAESRADLASVIEAEMRQRRDAPGPRLNELNDADRRDALAEVLSDYLHRTDDHTRSWARGTLLYALKDNAYIHDTQHNAIWNRVRDDHLDEYAMGRTSTNGERFTPTGMSEAERSQEVGKPLTEIAQRWRDRHEDTEARTAARFTTITAGENTAEIKAAQELIERARREHQQRQEADRRPTPIPRSITPTAPTPTTAPVEAQAKRGDRPAVAEEPRPRKEGESRRAAASRQPGTAETNRRPRETNARSGQPTTGASAGPEQRRDTEARHGQAQGGQAHLKLLIHARHSRSQQTAKTREERTEQSGAGASEHEFAPPSGRYSTGRSHRGETTPVRGGERTVGGSPPPARQQPTAQRASTR